MKFFPSYFIMKFKDHGQNHEEAFDEGVALAEKYLEEIEMPCLDRIFEAGIICGLVGMTPTEKTTDTKNQEKEK